MSNYFQPRGLRNNGNTCYFNATLQNLYRTVLFRRNLENVNALWRQKNRIPLVNEANSSENGSLAKILCNVKKLFCNVGNGELGKYFFLFLTSLTVYKAGSTGGLISTACWILEHLHFIRSGVHKLSSNLFDRSLYVDHGTNCSVMTFQQYSDLLRMCPGNDRLTVISSVYPWFEVAVLALLIWFLKGKYRFFMNFFGEAFSRCGKRLNSCDKVVLCCSGLLLYFTGHLMALSQPIYKLEQSPENLFVVFVMAFSACLLFYRLRIADGMLSLHQKCFHRPEEPVSVTLAKLFADINSESGSNNHNPQLVLEAVCRRSKRFYGFRQQDSHELLRHLLDAIREEERSLKLGSNLLTVVDKVFGGHFRTVYTCETCATPYCLYEAFLDISLPITLHEDTLNEISDGDINEIELVAVNRHKQQHSQAYEDTSDKHQDPKETVQTTSRRDSAYDNVSNPEKTETVQIHDESSRANEEKKSEAVEKRGQPKQIHVEPQVSHNNEGKERETVASQKQPKQQNLVTHEEPSKEKEEMKSENLQNKKQPKPNQHNTEFWLKVFTRSENLGKQYLCTACNKESTGDNYELTRGKKQTLICDPPAVLCIHMKRFRRTAEDFVKVNDHVEFSEYLDLKPYLADDCQRVGRKQESVMYSLLGVVVHSGSLESGHYTAYIKSEDGGGEGAAVSNSEKFLQQEGIDWDILPTEGMDKLQADTPSIQQKPSDTSQTKEWYYCSDSTVMQVDASDVFRQEAYLLFYERLC